MAVVKLLLINIPGRCPWRITELGQLACAPVPASLRPERVPDFPESKSCAGAGLWRFERIRQEGDWCTFCLCRFASICGCTLATTPHDNVKRNLSHFSHYSGSF